MQAYNNDCAVHLKKETVFCQSHHDLTMSWDLYGRSISCALLRASLHDAAASKVHLHSLVDPPLQESSDVGYRFAWTTCRLPPKDTQQYAVQNRIQTGCKRGANETHAGSHTHSLNRQRQSGVQRTTMKPGGYNILSPCGCN